MKTILLLACSLLFGFSLHAQIEEYKKPDDNKTTIANYNDKQLNDMVKNESSGLSLKTTGTNANYLNISNFLESPDYVRKLQFIAADYNIESSDVYTPTLNSRKHETYDVMFSTNKAQVNIKYDGKGEILQSNERYKDVIVPNYIIIKIMQDYPNCVFKDAICDITYKKDEGVSRSYKIKIMDGTQKRTLNLDADGNML